MDPMTMAMVGGAASNIIGGVMAGNAASKAADAAAKAQRQMYEKNLAILDSLDIPDVDKQKIALQGPEYVGDYLAETLGESALSEIALDPQLRQNQMDMLAQLKGLSEQGLGIQDEIALDQLGTEVAGAEQGRQKAILQQMAERGNLDSGAQLAAQLSSNQQSSQNQLLKAQEIAKQANQNRMNAMNMLSQQSAQMENSDWNRQAQQATAADAIQQFNANTRNQAQQYNLGNKQNIANQNASIGNQQEIYNKGLLQQDFLNRKGIADSKIGLNTAQGQNQAQSALQSGAGQAGMYSGIGSALGNAATSYGQYSTNQSNIDAQRAHELELAKLKK